MAAHTTPSIRTFANPMPACTPYRRKTTQKAPRKRSALLQCSALLQFSKHRADSMVLAACGGGDGPRGPVNNSSSCRRWWGDEPSNNHGQGTISILPGGMAFVLASVAVAGTLQAGPAFAAATTQMSVGLEVLAGQLEDAAADNTSQFSALHANYSPDAFTEEEKELVCPKQYRVREIVYVGH